MLGITDAERHPIENDDCVSNWSTEALANGPSHVLALETWLTTFRANIPTGLDAVHQFWKALGSEVCRPKET